MKYFTINIFNNTRVLFPDKPTLVFKQRHHACAMIRTWFKTPTPFIHRHIFEIRQLDSTQLPTNRNILLINDVNEQTSKEYCPFPTPNVDNSQTVLENTWKNL